MQDRRRPPTIDFHAHMLEDEALRQAARKTVLSGYGTISNGGPRAVNESTFRKMFDPQCQLEDMDRRGVDISVVSSATVIQGTSWADPRTDLELSQRCNDRIAEWTAKYPGRFIGSFTLPLQDISLSCAAKCSPCYQRDRVVSFAGRGASGEASTGPLGTKGGALVL